MIASNKGYIDIVRFLLETKKVDPARTKRTNETLSLLLQRMAIKKLWACY